VDGSPGFSLCALRMVKSKVEELAQDSKKLYLSLSCDDMSIRYDIYVYSQPNLSHKISKLQISNNLAKNVGNIFAHSFAKS